MNATNQIFSWKRYIAALRKECVENRLVLLLCIAAMFILCLAMLYSTNMIMGTRHQEIARATCVYDIVIGFYLFSAIVPSLAFSQLTHKTGRVELFSLPNSTTEKFAVRVTIYFIGFVVAYAVCVQLADWVRYAFFNQTVPPDNLIEAIKMSWDPDLCREKTIPSMINYMHIAPFFLMGSIVWPRWSVLKSFLASIVVSAIEMAIIYGLVGFVFGGDLDWESMKDSSLVMKMDVVFNIILIVGSLMLGWYLLKRKDIVSRKWWK